MSTTLQEISAQGVKQRLDEPGEFALLDVREPGPYADGHPFFVLNIPYSRLEPTALSLIPNKAVEIVLVDSGSSDDTLECAKSFWLERPGNIHLTTVALDRSYPIDHVIY